MAFFQISARGTEYGVFEARTEDEAVCAMYAAAGYSSPERAAEVMGMPVDTARSELTVVRADEIERWVPDYADHGWTREQAQRVVNRACRLMAAGDETDWTKALGRASDG